MVCPDCRDAHTVMTPEGDEVCMECGIVLNQRVPADNAKDGVSFDHHDQYTWNLNEDDVRPEYTTTTWIPIEWPGLKNPNELIPLIRAQTALRRETFGNAYDTEWKEMEHLVYLFRVSGSVGKKAYEWLMQFKTDRPTQSDNRRAARIVFLYISYEILFPGRLRLDRMAMLAGVPLTSVTFMEKEVTEWIERTHGIVLQRREISVLYDRATTEASFRLAVDARTRLAVLEETKQRMARAIEDIRIKAFSPDHVAMAFMCAVCDHKGIPYKKKLKPRDQVIDRLKRLNYL